MAQPWKPELHKAEDVLRYYENSDNVAFSVYAGHKIDETVRRYSYDGEDKMRGAQELAEALQSVASNPDNTNTYLLVLNKRVKNKLTPENTITFQLNNNRYLPVQSMAGTNNSGEIAALRAELAALRMQLAANEEQEEDDQEEDDHDDDNVLGSLMKNPEIQKQMIMGIMSLFGSPKVNAVAGIEAPEAEKITAAIERLQKHDEQLGDHLLILANMAEQNPTQFKTLLNFLK